MRKLTAILSAALCCAVMLASCGESHDLMENISPDSSQSYSFKSGETSAPGAYNHYKESVQNLAFSALGQLADGKNLCFSPSGLHSQLSILQNAAAGSTAAELKSLTGSLSLENLNMCNGYFFSRMAELSGEKSYAKTDNNLIFNEGTVVSQEFLINNADHFNHGIYRFDYAATDSLDAVNNLAGVEQSLKELENDITSAGAVSVSDSWLNGFSENGEGLLTGTESYLSTKTCEGFIKDFKNTPLKFIAVLPKQNTDFGEFLSGFDGDAYRALVNSFDIFSTCTVNLPAFSCESTNNLSPALKKLGVNSLFSEKPDFAGLSYGNKSKFGALVQKSSLSITKSGTEGAEFARSNAEKPKPGLTLSFDRPFIWAVVDNESMIPVLAGTVMEF